MQVVPRVQVVWRTLSSVREGKRERASVRESAKRAESVRVSDSSVGAMCEFRVNFVPGSE